MVELIPFAAIALFAFFLKNNKLNNYLTLLVFFCYLIFGTNYTTFGFDYPILRYTHRLIGVAAIIVLIFNVFKNRQYYFIKEPVPIFLGLFLFAILASFLRNEIFFEYYFHYLRNFIFVSGVVLYLYYFIDTNQKLDEIFKLIVSLTLMIAFFAIIETYRSGWDSRISLFFPNPNYLGASLLPGLSIIMFSKSKYFWVATALIIVAIFATGSRAAEVAVIFIIFTYLYYKKFKFVYLIPILILTSIVTTFFIDKIVINKNLSGSRFSLGYLSLKIIQDSPINGMGYGQFRKHYYKYIDKDIIALNNVEIIRALRSYDPSLSDETLEKEGITRNYEIMTHNDFLTIIAELGMIGILCLIFLFYKLYIEFKRLLLHSRHYLLLSIALIGSSLIFSLFHNNMTSYIFWFILILPFIINRNYSK